MANETALVPYPSTAPVEYRGLNAKQLRALKKQESQDNLVEVVKHLSDKGVNVLEAILSSQPITALAAFVLIEWLQTVNFERTITKVGQREGDYVWICEEFWTEKDGVKRKGERCHYVRAEELYNYTVKETYPLMPQLAGSVLEGAIVANMLLEGESGGNIMGLISSLLLK